jgi:hypothetical protein
MVGFARFTAIIFMLLGAALIVFGGVLALGGLVGSPASAPSLPGLAPNVSGMLAFAGAIAGGVVAFQGLLLAAVGQVLWLMAGMAHRAQLSIEYLAELVNRMGNANR